MKPGNRDALAAGNSRKSELAVDARTESAAIHEFDSLPQTSCFGFKRIAPKSKRSDWLKESVGAQPVQKPQKQASGRLCGAGAILRSFSSIGADTLAEAASTQRSSSLAKSDSKVLELGEDVNRPASSATIMASYDKITADKANSFSFPDSQRDGDREDGADSIECDEEVDTFDMPLWRVDPHDIYFVSKGDGSSKVCRLGKGDFGPVYLGVWQDQEVAVKLARQKPIALKAERLFQTNVAKLFGLDHPNVVQFMGACCWKGGRRSVLVTEFMDKGDLRGVLSREDLRQKLAWDQHGQTLALDIASGLAYLHSKGVVHGRLKTTNILMNRAGVAKISDASLARLLSHCKESVGEKSSRSLAVSGGAHLAPEIVDGGEPTTAADVYALGVILWELICKEKPVKPLRSVRTPGEAPARIAYLLECCLAEDPSARPTADSLVAAIASKY